MAGFGNETQQPLRVDPSMFVQSSNAAVQQSNVALLADAFRKGQISADDIIERYGPLAAAKEKAQLDILPSATEAEKLKNQASIAQNKYLLQTLANPDDVEDYVSNIQKAMQVAQSKPRFETYKKITPQGEVVTQKKIYDTPMGEIDEDTHQKAALYASWTPREFLKNGKLSFSDFMLGNKPGEAMVAPKKSAPTVQPSVSTGGPVEIPEGVQESPDIDAKRKQLIYTGWLTPEEAPKTPPGVVEALTVRMKRADLPEIIPTATVKAALPEVGSTLPSGEKVMETQVKAFAPETAKDIANMKNQIRASEEALNRINEARKIVHDPETTPVGPGIDEGAYVNQLIHRGGALVGIGRKKFDQQQRLDQSLAASIQTTIRSLAGTGNRVMQSEVNPDTGLFYKAMPKLSSTPENWDQWLNDQAQNFKNTIRDAISSLPLEEQAKYQSLLQDTTSTPAVPTGTATPSQKIIDLPGVGRGYLTPEGKFVRTQ